jgi:hypothetical protein
MRSREKLIDSVRVLALFAAGCAATVLAGCGMPAAPQPPSLELPAPVSDLTAVRNGDQVALAWTMPKRDTSRVNLKGDVTARLCRTDGSNPCTVVATLNLAPGASGSFTETLPLALTSGEPRTLNYFVELPSKRGRSAGQSNAATVLEGQAPAAVAGLSADVRKEGVVLRWIPDSPESYPTQVRLERTVLTPAPARKEPAPLAEPPEPTKQNLLVPQGEVRGRAIDKEIRFGETYEYRAQRIAQITVNGKEIELAGPFSQPVRVDAQNIFAPPVPMALAAVAASVGSSGTWAIDLSWQPDADPDLAGYAVYRREAVAEGQAASAWQRISPAQPVIGPGFHDAAVAAGHNYEYAVTAIGQNGRESEKSAIAQEAVPSQ